MKRIFALLLAMLMVLSIAACDKSTQESSAPETTEATNAPDTTTIPVQQQIPEGTPNYFQLSICDEEGNTKALSAYDDDAGNLAIDYQGQIRKVTTMELAVMDQIMAELAKTGLVALNGENLYEDGLASASMYISYADGNYLGAGYSGSVPQAFLDGYDVMDLFFQDLLAEVPEYVPRPVVTGEVNPEALAELEAILETANMGLLDMYSISDVPKDEYFNMTMGLSGNDGILCGTNCSPMMSATAFSCMVATLEDESKVSDVQKDFAANISWNRWVCVSAESALIAQKGNIVLCLASSGDMYEQTASAIEACGWTVLETLSNK